ncbi:uncharacterized protein LOC114280672 [Camellia sinensis]|uniref:uncharacterized protein LOC114280672 n=1 Tax=Camellia sinensis TaxID=4442 RepID=UPI001036A9FC|nr:uncharacterized protein LOC114280672 [Camellia sinensis]
MVTYHSTCSLSMPSTSSNSQRNRSTLINRFVCIDDELEDLPTSISIGTRAHKDSCRHYLGKMDVLCPYCSALHWIDENLTKSSIKRPLFGTCCLEGIIRLPLLITPPPPLQALYDGNNDQSKSFRSYTRVYNAANAFTSLGATLDPRVLIGRGPTSFTIHGEFRHRTGSLQPQPGQDASYAQLYIYDPYSALEIRNRRNPNLRMDVLKTIQDSLLQVNAFVDKYRQAHAILHQLDSAGHNLPAHLHYSSTTDRRRYNLPTTDEIAIVIPGDGTELNQGKLRAELYQELSDMDPDYVRLGQIGQRPCGARNPQAPCMENGRCTKRYPRAFTETTTMDQDGYPIYRRRNNGQVHTVRGQEVDNRDVVPYNAYLSKLFNCHINVEVCARMRCVKYIHKYIYKGYDRATMVLGMINEIQQYLDARYIGPPEAAWRIFAHPLYAEMPTIVRLALHLPGMHRVIFNPEESLQTIQSRAGQQMSTLTGFFAYCAASEDECPFTYQEFPQHFVWLKSEKRWKSRERRYAIGRMYFASPNCGEIFYLRLLLTVVKGPKSFQSLRTVDDVVHDTFKLACIARGLLKDDKEWIQCLKEAAVIKTGYQLRRLFSIILTQCSPLNPCALWNQFSTHICDDLPHKICKSLIDFPPMPQPTANWSRNAYNTITSSVFQNKGTVFFLNGGAGTGKTFLYNTIALKCRSLGHIVVTVASSGIASLLLSISGRFLVAGDHQSHRQAAVTSQPCYRLYSHRVALSLSLGAAAIMTGGTNKKRARDAISST